MTTDDSGREIARLFRELRRADEASAPSFRRTLERARRDGRSSGTRRLRFAAAAALLVLFAAALLWFGRPNALRAPETAVPLAEWKSSTDGLLRTPGEDLLLSVPALPQAVPDYSSIAGAPKPASPEPTRPPKGA